MTAKWRLIVIPVICAGWVIVSAGALAQEDSLSSSETETDDEAASSTNDAIADFMDWVESGIEGVEIEYPDLQPAGGAIDERGGGGGDGGGSGGH